jgi:hypothetical protein
MLCELSDPELFQWYCRCLQATEKNSSHSFWALARCSVLAKGQLIFLTTIRWLKPTAINTMPRAIDIQTAVRELPLDKLEKLGEMLAELKKDGE